MLLIIAMLVVVANAGPLLLLRCAFTWRARWKFHAVLPLVVSTSFHLVNARHNFFFQGSGFEFYLPGLFVIVLAAWVIVLPLRYRAAQRRACNELSS
jgi:hypothetical protein